MKKTWRSWRRPAHGNDTTKVKEPSMNNKPPFCWWFVQLWPHASLILVGLADNTNIFQPPSMWRMLPNPTADEKWGIYTSLYIALYISWRQKNVQSFQFPYYSSFLSLKRYELYITYWHLCPSAVWHHLSLNVNLSKLYKSQVSEIWAPSYKEIYSYWLTHNFFALTFKLVGNEYATRN